MTAKDKVMENRLRRKADRMGYRLVKNRRRDPGAIDFGGYALINIEHGGYDFGQGVLGTPSASLEEVREFLEGN